MSNPTATKWLTDQHNGCVITVRVTPRASQSRIQSQEEEWLRVQLKAPPVDGKANTALINLFAKLLGIPKSSLTILTGTTARLKRLHVSHHSAKEIKTLLTPHWIKDSSL